MTNVIILIHGLGGTKDGTWGKFPQLLEEDKDIPYQVHSVGYTTPALDVKSPRTYCNLFARAPSLLNIANAVLTEIEVNYDLKKDNIILAGHSLGGVVLKKVLLILNESSNQGQVHNIKKVCFFDVPHGGSGYANIGKYIYFRNNHLKSLVNNSIELDDLNDQWVKSSLNDELVIWSILAENDDIVSATSSKSIFREHEVRTILGTNHKTIVKPKSADSTLYKTFKDFILKEFLVPQFSCPGSRNINDWRNMERGHNFGYVADSRREKNLKALSDALNQEQTAIRLIGASGMGKTRILLEAIEKNSMLTNEHILIWDGEYYKKEIMESVRPMVEENAQGLVIVENCPVDLHNALAREIHKMECSLKIVTIGYDNKQVDESITILLEPMADRAIVQMLTPTLASLDRREIERIARFAEGYPLMAVLITNEYLEKGELLGSIMRESIVKNLINVNGEIQKDYKDILTACSLFDVFGTSEGATGEEARYIYENIAGSNQKTFDEVLNIFVNKQIINRTKNYARVIPKPLALALASDWWKETSSERQFELFSTLPESLCQSFCIQISYLDNHPNVQNLSNKFFGGIGPFTKAEVLLTEKGSLFFRSFVEINQQSTSSSLYYILKQYSHNQLLRIRGKTRRNLIWGLEKLCFHSQVFEKSAWCLLLLASAENEDYSNNAIGIFTQLYKVYLSGTQTEPKERLDILRTATNESRKFDSIVIKALKQALTTVGEGGKIVGAEYQGSKATLKDWEPQSYQEIYDYWQQAMSLLLSLLGKNPDCDKQIRKVVGSSISPLLRYQQIDIIDEAITTITSKYGACWPEALSTIKSALNHDSDRLTKETIDALHEWSSLLNPDATELADKLKIIVIDPPNEFQEDKEGRLFDISEENAKSLATSIGKKPEVLKPYLSDLLQGEQVKSYAFGYQLVLEVKDPQKLLDLILNTIITVNEPNSDLLVGVFRGIHEISAKLWSDNINRLASNKDFVQYFPICIQTGSIDSKQLATLLELILTEQLPQRSVNSLAYGDVTRNLNSSKIVSFCLDLAKTSLQAKWTAFNVLHMYYFNNKSLFNELQKAFRKLVIEVPLYKMRQDSCTMKDVYYWKDIIEKLLENYDEELALSLTEQLIAGCNKDYEHGNIHNIRLVLNNLMLTYEAITWPKFADAIISAKGSELYWLQQLLGRGFDFKSNTPSVLSVISIENIINWCKEHDPDGAILVSRCLDIFETDGDTRKPSELFIAIINNFGSNELVTTELYANFGSRVWVGSPVPDLEADKEDLTSLLDYKYQNVSKWMSKFIQYIDTMIEKESKEYEERNFAPYR